MIFKDLLDIFPRKDKAVLLVLSVAGIASSFLDVIGIGLLFPYVSIIQDPNKILTFPYLAEGYRLLGFKSTDMVFYIASVGLIALFFLKGVIGSILNQGQSAFINSKQAQLSGVLLDYYLARPFSFIQNTNSATLIANVTSSIISICSGLLQSALALLTELAVLLGLLGVLVFLNPGVFLAVAILIGGIASTIFLVVKSRLRRYGEEADRSWKGMIKATNEAIGATKEITVLGCPKYFVDIYLSHAQEFVKTATKNALINYLPRVMLETGAVISLVLISVTSIMLGRAGEDLFAMLAVFAVATVRMVPSANRILQAWNAIHYHSAALRIIGPSLIEARKLSTEPSKPAPEPMPFNDMLSVAINHFHYPSNPHFQLKGIDVKIRRGQTVAFIGHSGSGKSTLIDLMLGLFEDYDGAIKVDGQEIRSNVEGWRRSIGFIPQSLYLRDDTIARNVAFGVSDGQIDYGQLDRVIRLAGLQKVVESQRDGLQTVIGDRGARLSGGERQRIGIARALYHEPDLLILDEATSALDNMTEREIVESILSLSPAKTIIVIAHRLSTVRRCDTLYLMSAGEIIDHGDYGGLSARHPDFMRLDTAA